MKRAHRRLVIVLHLQLDAWNVVWEGQLDFVGSVGVGVDELVWMDDLRGVAAVIH